MNDSGTPFELILGLVSKVREFQQSKSGTQMSIESFAIWLNQQVLIGEEKDRRTPRSLKKELLKKEKSSEFTTSPINVQLTLLLYMLSKHFKLYSRKVLHDTDLVSMDGHTFLASLSHTESMTKMELIRAHYMETPSGIEVIKRLLKKGFIEEFDDPNDRRAKRIKITKKGVEEFQATFSDIRKVIEIMAGNLSDRQRINLVGLLDDLNDHHNGWHEKAKKYSLDELLISMSS